MAASNFKTYYDARLGTRCMRVAVSGGLGFIGSRLAESFARDGHAVVVLDNLHPQIHKDDSSVSRVSAFATVYMGDVRDAAAWDNVLNGTDLVLHMAAETGTGQSMDTVARYADVNVVGTAMLADALARHPCVRRVFLPSSRAIYGEGLYTCDEHGRVLPHRRKREDMQRGIFALHCPICGKHIEPLPTSETTEPRPASIYAVTKLTQEQVMQLSCESYGVDLRIARYQNVYGTGQALRNPYTGVLVLFAQQIAEGKALNIYEDGKIARDFVHIDDVVAATRIVIEGEGYCGPVNIGSGLAATLLDVVHVFEQVLSRRVPYRITADYRFGDIRYAAADIGRLHSLGFKPAVDLLQGIADVIAWVKTL